jgi:hypothetical protein
MRLVTTAGVGAVILAALLGTSAFGLDPAHLKPVARDQVTGERFTLNLQSDQGDFLGGGMPTYHYTEADVASFFVGIETPDPLTAPGTLTFFFETGKGLKAHDDWQLDVSSAKLGKPLAVGTYFPVARESFAVNTAGLDFVINGRGCDAVTGRFTVSAIAFDCTAAGLPHLARLVMSFEDHCEGGQPALRGQLAYTDATGVSCDSVGSGNPGGGTPPPTPTPTPTPTAPVVVLSDDVRATPILMGNAASATVPFSTFIPDTSAGPVSLSATTDADNLLASVTPPVITSTGAVDGVLTIQTTSSTAAGDHAVTLTATTSDGTSASATIFVTVICDPPFILGLDQPKGSTLSPGRSTLLSVKASGSGPFTYQWFNGSSGLVNFPLAGGTTPNFTTSAVNDTTSYWVRVTNPCGSVDSQTATITVPPAARRTGRR